MDTELWISIMTLVTVVASGLFDFKGIKSKIGEVGKAVEKNREAIIRNETRINDTREEVDDLRDELQSIKAQIK